MSTWPLLWTIHVLTLDFSPAFSNVILDICALVALVIAETSDEVVK